MQLYYISFWIMVVVNGLALGSILYAIPVHPIKSVGQTMLLIAANAGVIYIIFLCEENGVSIIEWQILALYLSALGINIFVAQDAGIDRKDNTLVLRHGLLAGYAQATAIIGMLTMLYLIVGILLPNP